jgi:two-component system sensor histidine kinase DesK
MEVRVDVRLPDVSAEADALLGWAVREGATNVLRHSRARTCSIVATRDGDRLLLELVNDGIGAGADAPGSGLSSLAERFAAAKGVVLGGRIDGERFRLRVELPA